MASGFFLGGMAQGMNAQQGLDIQQQAETRLQQHELLAQVDKHIADTMGVIAETVKQLKASGNTTDQAFQQVQPLLADVAPLAAKAGRDPNIYVNQAKALAAASGPEADKFQKVAETPQGAHIYGFPNSRTNTVRLPDVVGTPPTTAGDEDLAGFKTKHEKVQAENALRDDYLKQAKDYMTVRDAKSRMDSLGNTGIGDVALVYSFMKVLDPPSTVREGEFATASNAAGVPSAIQAMYNKLVGGGRLGEQARAEIRAEAEKIYNTKALQHDKVTTSFANMAKRYKMDVNNVIPDIQPPQADKAEGVTPGGIKFRFVK